MGAAGISSAENEDGGHGDGGHGFVIKRIGHRESDEFEEKRMDQA